MKQEQAILCEKHKVLLQFIWTWGWGCALQPLLVEVSTWFEWYASEQMCRRGIRELKKAGLLKEKTWVDGKTEILILTKPAIAFVSGKNVKEISSFPKHSTRDSEILSICRMMFVLKWAQVRGARCYSAVYDYFQNRILTIHRRIGDLMDYWLNTSFYRQFTDYTFQKNCLDESRLERIKLHLDKDDQWPAHKELLSALTIESLHRRSISILGVKKEGNGYLFNFCVFNIHELTAKKVMDYYLLCHDWVKSLHMDSEAKLTVVCVDQIQQNSLKQNLMKTHHGRPFWEYTLARKADTSKGIPVDVRNIDLKAKYMKVGSLR